MVFLYSLAVSKRLCRGIWVGQFRIVYIKYGYMIYMILNYDLQTIFIDNYIRSYDIDIT